MEVEGTEGGDAVLIGGVAEEREHEGGKFLGIIVTEEETGVALVNEVRHLVTGATDAGKTEGESLDEDKTIGLEVTRHAEDVTHIVILCFLTERYLPYEVITINRIAYRVLCWPNDK